MPAKSYDTEVSPRRHVQRITMPLSALLMMLLLAPNMPSTAAYADYGEPDDIAQYGDLAGGGAGGGGEAIISNDDIYDPALLQQEVEAREHMQLEQQQQQLMHTEAPIKDVRNMSHNKIHMDHTTNINTEEEGEHMPSEEYDERLHRLALGVATLTTPKYSMQSISPAGTMMTATVPEYVRKAKSESFPPTLATASSDEEQMDSNASISDYMEDDVVRNTPKHTNENGNDTHEQHADGIVPLAMKFYQHDAHAREGQIAEEDNTLKEEHQQHPMSLPQQQLLPDQKQQQQFQQHRSDEDYYEDSYESKEQGAGSVRRHQQWRTTAAPLGAVAMPPATLPTYQQPNIAIARAAIPGFPLSFAIPSIESTLATTTSAAGAAALLPPAVTETAPAAVPVIPTFPTPISATTTGISESATTKAAASSTTTMRPAGNKQGKQINITRRKLLPHEQLRNYIEDAYIRMPLAVIVDPSAESLEKTKALWRDALRTNFNIKIVLVSLNASGVPAAFNFNNTRQFLAGLNGIKEHDGGDAFIGIVHASELVPYDSAVFISTAVIPPHTELVQDAAITLLKKRIRLYVIWYGERTISENETQEAVGGILGEVAIRSGGEILHIVGGENSQELEGSTLTLVADAFRGSQEVEIPVDTTLSSLHVKIDAPMRTATLETPNGDINLKKLVKFKSRVLTPGGDDKRLDAYVPMTKLRKATIYKLNVIPESLDQEYSVFVRAERKADLFLDDMIKRFDSYFMGGYSLYPTMFRSNRLQTFTTSFTPTVKTYGNLKFPEEGQKGPNEELDMEPKTEVETFSETEIKGMPAIKTNTSADVTAVNMGNQRSSTVLQPTTKIEMGVQSQLLVVPGMMAQLYFEITNTRTESIYHNIQVVDERRFLLRLTPQSLLLRPNELVTVAVTLLVPNGTPQGTIDRITFTCHGGGTSSLSVSLKVTTTHDSQDTTSPSISWFFGNRCDNVATDSSRCAERFWTMDITAQDWETGILRLQSTPAGLINLNSYTVGTTEPLKASYVATCCEPKVSLVAYDIAGNQRSYSIDVRDIVLTEAAIAAIVLGVLLLILLIVLLILGIIWCCRRRQVSLDLPTYRSHSTRSME